MKPFVAFLVLVAGLMVAGCIAAPTSQAPTKVAAEVPTISPPEPTSAPTCPEPTEGTQLLRHDEYGYCVLYPDGLVRIGTPPDQTCLIPEGPAMACHNAAGFFNVADAGGRTAAELADEKQEREGGFGPERESLTIAGLEAVVLPLVAGQASTRQVWFVHDDRLYALAFVLPEPEDTAGVERYERLYAAVIDSFTLIPPTQAQETSAVGPSSTSTTGGSGSAAVVFVEAGNGYVWEEATGKRRTLIDTGDVVRVELSDDAELVAFVRRSYFAAGGFDRNEQSALWVVGLDGSNPRELVSVQELRTQVGAVEADSTNFPRLGWVPDSHRLLYSGNTYDAHGMGEGAHTALKGVYLIDADTLATAELAPAEQSFAFVPSPDGRQVVLVTTTGLQFFEVDSGRRRLEFPAEPVVGDTGWFTNAGVWTQDSGAFLINALVEPTNVTSDYALWQVPVDGSPAGRLIAFSSGGGSVIFAPDGSSAAIVRSASGIGPSAWFFLPLPDYLGPLAVPEDTFDYSQLTWSPGGAAYVFEPLRFDAQSVPRGRDNLLPLCHNAVQALEFCGPAIPLGELIGWLEWLDRDRFLYVTYEPRRLYLGSLDGGRILLGEDPPSFAAVAATCTDDAQFVSDLTIPDGSQFLPGAVFRKTWRLRNSGTCTWDAAYRLGFLSGERMSGPRSTPLGGLEVGLQSVGPFPVVRPGEEIELSVLLVAPTAAGEYRGQWQLFAPDGTPFGTRPYVQIQVP